MGACGNPIHGEGAPAIDYPYLGIVLTRQVSGHEFTRAGPEFTQGTKRLEPQPSFLP